MPTLTPDRHDQPERQEYVSPLAPYFSPEALKVFQNTIQPSVQNIVRQYDNGHRSHTHVSKTGATIEVTRLGATEPVAVVRYSKATKNAPESFSVETGATFSEGLDTHVVTLLNTVVTNANTALTKTPVHVTIETQAATLDVLASPVTPPTPFAPTRPVPGRATAVADYGPGELAAL